MSHGTAVAHGSGLTKSCGFQTVFFFHSAKPLWRLCLLPNTFLLLLCTSNSCPFPKTWLAFGVLLLRSFLFVQYLAHLHIKYLWSPTLCHILFVGARCIPVNIMNSYTLDMFILLVGKKYIVNRSLECVVCHHMNPFVWNSIPGGEGGIGKIIYAVWRKSEYIPGRLEEHEEISRVQILFPL